ncbi:hypothetical protein JTB14_031360 [Gonioctena quinquepunctata]|nr:hypothetical protein JTB14_031360 [Gonioctena quinquepunctata]
MYIPRRSDPKTKGIPPERNEDIDENMIHDTSSIHEKNNLKVESKLTKSSSSRRRLLEIELKEVRISAEIERSYEERSEWNENMIEKYFWQDISVDEIELESDITGYQQASTRKSAMMQHFLQLIHQIY